MGSVIITEQEKKLRDQKAQEEQALLEEIEASFCVAGYEIITSTIFKESIKQAQVI